MYVLKGQYKSYSFKPYRGSNTRPTTNKSKEIIFSVLENYIDFEGLTVFDFFAGTGNISLEFLSRGVKNATSFDIESKNIRYMTDIKTQLNIANWEIIKQDVFPFVTNHQINCNLYFADPPYDYPLIHPFVNQIQKQIAQNDLEDVIFIIEHASRIVLNQEFLWLKKEIGDTSISFYKKP